MDESRFLAPAYSTYEAGGGTTTEGDSQVALEKKLPPQEKKSPSR